MVLLGHLGISTLLTVIPALGRAARILWSMTRPVSPVRRGPPAAAGRTSALFLSVSLPGSGPGSGLCPVAFFRGT